MAMRLRRKIGWGFVALLGLLAGVIAAAPLIVDVEGYKPAIIRAVKDATGRELVIEGPLKFTMFPQPRISASQVRFANALGGKGAQMVDVRWIGVSPSWSALLRGQAEVGRLTLFKPNIVLETDAEGRPNWEFKPGAGAVQPEGAPSAGLHLAIGRLRIVQGTLSYSNPATGQTLQAEQVDVTASVGSLDGPFKLIGTATVNNVPVDLDVDVGGPSPEGHSAKVKLKVQSGTLDFDGRVSSISPAADVKGRLSVATGALTDFVAAIVRATGQPEPGFDASLFSRFTFDGGIDVSAERIALESFRMAIGDETASGSMALTSGRAPSLEGRVSLSRIDADAWQDLLARPGLFRSSAIEPAKTPAQPAPPRPPPAATTPPKAPASLSPFPVEAKVALALDAAEIVYRKRAVRDVALSVEIAKGAISLPRIAAVLPGDMILKASVASPAQPGGEISLSGPKLRETLDWLGIETPAMPAGRLQSLELQGKLVQTPTGMQANDLAFSIDGQKGTGSASAVAGASVAVTAALQFDRLELDPYVPKPTTEPQALPPTVAPAAAAPTPVVPPDRNAPTFALKLKVGKLVYRGETLGGVEGDLAAQGSTLKINTLKVADLLGARFDLRGQVNDIDTNPRFDVAFNAALPDTDKLLAYAGLPTFINGKIGAATASGSMVGTPGAITLRNATVTMLGATARATGAMVLGENFRFDFPNFGLEAQDAGRLVAAATGRDQPGIGPLSAAGSFKGNARSATFAGNLKAVGTAMSGQIDATLGKRPNIAVNLRIPNTLDLDNWLGVSTTPGATAAPTRSGQPAAAPARAAPAAQPLPPASPRKATGKSIDLSALRAFDLSLTLETTAISVASLTVTYADLQANLRNGVFTIAKLTGQFFGGAVDFAGTIDATGAALSVDLRGSLQGIYLGEMLRGAAGTSTFGNEHLTVSVDGKISIMDITVQGQGSSPEQIRDSLTGHGQLSGYLYPSVVKGSLGFASFATGVGSIFSTEMGFNSAVLQAFINGQNPIAGQVTLSGGALSLQNNTVQGQNAVARIDSRTSLIAATTDTTIALDTGSRGSTDYVMTVKGPVASPNMSTTGR